MKFGAFVVASFLFCASAFAQSAVVGSFLYRGFVVDPSAARSVPDLGAVEVSVRHQIDIVADCGASPETLRFFRSREVVLKLGQGDGGGRFAADGRGVVLDAAIQPFEKPILLHELCHAYHFFVLPGRFRNAEVLRFYNNARRGRLYPRNAYVLSNVKEFFAVTASLYLWGNVDRPPHTRENLKEKQSYYYAWLGQLFGVQK